MNIFVPKKTQEAASFPSFEDGKFFGIIVNWVYQYKSWHICKSYTGSFFSSLWLFHKVPGPCEPEDLIDGIIFAANYLGCTQVLSDKNPSKTVRMSQAHEAVSRIKVADLFGDATLFELGFVLRPLVKLPLKEVSISTT